MKRLARHQAASQGSWELPVFTEQGVFRARYSTRGLVALAFPPAPVDAPASEGSEVPANVRQWHCCTAQAVEAILRGEVPSDLPPLDWAGHPAFYQRVWKALMAIPAGQVRTYAQVARIVGSSKSARAVGQACASNPIPLLVPCHRVVRSDSRPGGFSAGPAWKELLLRLEGSRAAGPGSC
jgi:methylated-DNA-[protein]-cysteine S-methyltransferase